MTNEILNQRVLRLVKAAGKAVTCASISIELGEGPKDVRDALHCLIDDGFVVECRGLFERARGGYFPEPEDAA